MSLPSLTVDSSVYLSALNEKDPYFSVTQNFFTLSYEREWQIVLPIQVIFEVTNILHRKKFSSKTRQKSFFTRFFEDPYITVIEQDSLFADFFLKYHIKYQLKTSDAIIAITAKVAESQLITWDQQLISQTRKHLHPGKTPEQFLRMSYQSPHKR